MRQTINKVNKQIVYYIRKWCSVMRKKTGKMGGGKLDTLIREVKTSFADFYKKHWHDHHGKTQNFVRSLTLIIRFSMVVFWITCRGGRSEHSEFLICVRPKAGGLRTPASVRSQHGHHCPTWTLRPSSAHWCHHLPMPRPHPPSRTPGLMRFFPCPDSERPFWCSIWVQSSPDAPVLMGVSALFPLLQFLVWSPI